MSDANLFNRCQCGEITYRLCRGVTGMKAPHRHGYACRECQLCPKCRILHDRITSVALVLATLAILCIAFYAMWTDPLTGGRG